MRRKDSRLMRRAHVTPSHDGLEKPLPARRRPDQARAARARLRRLAALTGLRRPGCFASKRSWLFVSEIAPIAAERRGRGVAWRALRPFF